jgi:hypothetical protein
MQIVRLHGFNLSAFQGQLFGLVRSPAPRLFEKSLQRSKAALSETSPTIVTIREQRAREFRVRAIFGRGRLGPYLALKLVGECGTDLSAWPGHGLPACAVLNCGRRRQPSQEIGWGKGPRRELERPWR